MRLLNFFLNLAGGVATLLLLPPETSSVLFATAVAMIALICVLSAWGFNDLNKATSVDPVATLLVWVGGCGLMVSLGQVMTPNEAILGGIATVAGAAALALIRRGAAANPEKSSDLMMLGAYLGPLMLLATSFILLGAMGMWRGQLTPNDAEAMTFAVITLLAYVLGLVFAKSGVNAQWLQPYLGGASMGWGTLIALAVVVLGRGRSLNVWSVCIPLAAVFVMVEAKAFKAVFKAIGF